MLGHLKEAGEVLDRWKQSTTRDFDDALSGTGLTGITNQSHGLLIERNSDPYNKTK